MNTLNNIIIWIWFLVGYNIYISSTLIRIQINGIYTYTILWYILYVPIKSIYLYDIQCLILKILYNINNYNIDKNYKNFVEHNTTMIYIKYELYIGISHNNQDNLHNYYLRLDSCSMSLCINKAIIFFKCHYFSSCYSTTRFSKQKSTWLFTVWIIIVYIFSCV